MRHSRPTVLLATLVLGALVACSGSDDPIRVAVATTTTSTTSTVPPSTTTTAVPATTPPTVPPPPPPPTAPLTGEVIADPAALNRPAIVVKIDNADPAARPQQGLNEADVVYEEMVEGSVTRFAAVFHSRQAVGRVVPVRSARTTDIALLAPLRHPLFAWSGANADFVPLIRAAPIVDVGHGALGGEYHRQPGRPGSHDLYITTEQLWLHTPAGAVPPSGLFHYRNVGEPAPATAAPMNHVSITFGGGAGSAPVDWWWDPGLGVYRRFQKGSAHVDETGAQIAPVNVVVQFVRYFDTGHVDTGGAIVYEADLVGDGMAWILTGGRLVEGRWWKPSVDAVTQFVDLAGAPIRFTPGRTWVELPWEGRAHVAAE